MKRDDMENRLFYPEDQSQPYQGELQLSRRGMSAISQRREQDFVGLICGVADMGKFTGLTKNGIDNHVAITSYIDNAIATCPSALEELRGLQRLHFKGICKKIVKWGDE